MDVAIDVHTLGESHVPDIRIIVLGVVAPLGLCLDRDEGVLEIGVDLNWHGFDVTC